MKHLYLLLSISLLLSSCSMLPDQLVPGSDDEEEEDHPLTILVINDIYRLDNLPYVRTLRSQLEQKEGDVLLLHAGDFLYPSLLSQRFDGAQMVDVMNHLDGDGKAFDQRMYATFGNHEFEKGKLKYAGMLQNRIRESQFSWLGSNIEFRQIAPGRRVIQADNLLPYKLLTVSGVKVGLVSATTDMNKAEYIARFIPPVEAVGNTTRFLRQQGAEVVIALTHQSLGEDKAMLAALGDNAPDMIAGGHEHERQNWQVDGRRIVKADSDAASVAIIRMHPGSGKPPKSSLEFVELPGKYAADPGTQQQIAMWDTRFDQEYCAEKHEPTGCLSQVLGKTQVALTAEELTIRRFETNLGNWLADTAREQFASQGAQIAFLNSGGMRLNQNLSPGNITRKHIDNLFAYPTRLVMISLTGRQLQEVVDHSISGWTGHGHFLQVSGFAFRHDPEKGAAEQLSLITPTGIRLVQPDETILAVVNDYLVDSNGDQDGYTMLSEKMIVDHSSPRPELKDRVIASLKLAGNAGIAPKVEGRICNKIQKNTPCLLG